MSFKELESIRMKLPTVEELDGWIPVDVEENIVFAKKEIENEIVIKPFKPEGIWKKVYSLMKRRKELLEKLESEAKQKYDVKLIGKRDKEHGPRLEEYEDQTDRIERIETSADFIGLMRKGFYIDEQDRVRFIPETEAEKLEYSSRVSLAKQYSANVPVEETRLKVEKAMRKYRSEDLKRAKPVFAGDKDIDAAYEAKSGKKPGIINGFCDYQGGVYVEISKRKGSLSNFLAPTTFTHEMGHSVFIQRNKGFSTDFYRDIVADERLKEKFSIGISRYSISHPSGRELVAETFEFMRHNPAKAAAMSKVDPDFRRLFRQIQKDTGYRLISRGESK